MIMRLSIRKFLLINLFLAITLTTILATIGNYYLDKQVIQSNLDNLLSQAGLTFRALVNDDINATDLKKMQAMLEKIPEEIKTFLPPSDDPEVALYQNKYQFQLWDNNGKLLIQSANAPLVSLASEQSGFSDKTIDGQPWRVFTIHDPKLKITFVVGENYDMRNLLSRRIMIDDFYIVFTMYPLSGLLIWFIIGRGLRTLERVTGEVAQRAIDHLDSVDLKSVPVPVEVKPLVDELNKLFLRLKQAFDREQRFAGDAAHELRTPLAALKTQAQVALKSTNPQEQRMHLYQVINCVDRCTHVVQQLLTLSRMSPESVTLEELSNVDFPKIASEVIAQLVPSALEKQIEIELVAKDANCHIMGNITGIHALIRNLVDNAIRYTPNGGNVKVIIQNKAENIILKVIDNGPGIPANLRSRVFERFFRILGTSAQGSGLGLAIVLQIAKLHNGHVTLGIPDSGVGLEVEVAFPKQNLLDKMH